MFSKQSTAIFVIWMIIAVAFLAMILFVTGKRKKKGNAR